MGESYYDQVRAQVGEPPVAPPQRRFLGFNFNQQEEAKYAAERHTYDTIMSKVAGEVIDRAMNPMNAKQFSQISGMKMDEGADQSQFRNVTTEEPSLVPKTAMHYTRGADMPMGSRMSPLMVQDQGPGSKLETPLGKAASFGINNGDMPLDNPLAQRYGRGESDMFQEGRRPTRMTLQSAPAELQGPPNPAGPELYQREGDPLQTTTREIDPLSPASPMQRHIANANIQRERTWPRQSGLGMSGGASTHAYDINALMQTVNPYTGKQFTRDEATSIVIGKEAIAGGGRANNLDARTRSSEQRAGLMGAQTVGQQQKNDEFPRAADDRHSEVESRNQARAANIDYHNALLGIRADLANTEKQARQNAIDNPLGWAKLEEMKKKNEFLMKYVAANKGNMNPETEALLREDMAEMAGVEGEVGKQSLYDKIFGDKPNVQRKAGTGNTGTRPQGRPTTPGSSTQTGSSDVSREIDGMLKSKNIDPATAQKEGVIYKGKTYKFQDGKWGN